MVVLFLQLHDNETMHLFLTMLVLENDTIPAKNNEFYVRKR
jgi:hypothetical protein